MHTTSRIHCVYIPWYMFVWDSLSLTLSFSSLSLSLSLSSIYVLCMGGKINDQLFKLYTMRLVSYILVYMMFESRRASVFSFHSLLSRSLSLQIALCEKMWVFDFRLFEVCLSYFLTSLPPSPSLPLYLLCSLYTLTKHINAKFSTKLPAHIQFTSFPSNVKRDLNTW